MATTTSGINKVGNNFYKTSVTTNADGSLKATTFRTDAKGGNSVAVYTANTTADGKSTTKSFESGATNAEKAAFNNPNSPERKTYTQQVQSQNPYGNNPTAQQQQAINNAAGKGNAAKPGDAGGTDAEQQGTPVPGTNDPTKGSDIGLGGALKYPLDMKATQDHILFTMIENTPRSLGSGGSPFTIGARSQSTEGSKGTVILPLQSGINDTNSVGWGQADLDPLQIAGAKMFGEAALKGLNTVGGNVGSAVEDIQKNAEAAKAGVTYAAMAEALGKPANELLARTSGAIINPNVELLFNGVSLRSFNYNFRLSARGKDEGAQIQKIIYFFKKGMAAKQTKSGYFLKSPYIFKIEYKFNGGKHPGMNLIKKCALQNFGVNYVPDAQYSSHYDGILSAYDITMQFTELDPLYFDDYDGSHPIGY